MRGAKLVVLFGALALVVVGCRRRPRVTARPQEQLGGAPAVDLAAARMPPLEGWPRVMVVAPGDGPALYLGPGVNDPAIGYLEPGVRVRVESAPIRNRVEVIVAGTMPARGWVPLTHLGMHVQRRGRVEGTSAYLGTNDIVNLISRQGSQSYGIAVRPVLREGALLGPFNGELPATELSDQPFDEAESLTAGECRRLPTGETLALYGSVGGEPVATLPALDPPLQVTVLRQQSVWFGVRVGSGPYVTGYVRGALTPCEPPPDTGPRDGTPVWMSRESGPLFRVAAGTRLSFNGQTVARLRSEGWARALGSPGTNMVDVFVSVDDTAALRGLVPRGALTAAGALDRSVVVQGLSPITEHVMACRTTHAPDQPAYEGRIVVGFTIAEDGSVSEVRARESTLGNDAMQACILEVVGRVQFASGPQGGPVTIAYPFAFHPAASPSAPTAPGDGTEAPPTD